MSQRKTSAEIINATLLEVFLALVFLVFGLAVFQKQRAIEAQESEAAAKALADSAMIFQQQRDSATEVARAESARAKRAETVADSLRTVGNLWPDCAKDYSALLTITLLNANQVRVQINRTAFGFTAGQILHIPDASFNETFAHVRAAGESSKCRHSVRVIDSEAVAKADYKRLLRTIRGSFRLKDFLN